MEGCDILMDVNQVFVRQGNNSLESPFRQLRILLNLDGCPGSLLHIVKEKQRSRKGRLSLSSKSERSGGGTIAERGEVRQCFLFSNTLIIATRYYDSIRGNGPFLPGFQHSFSLSRTADGKLHLLPEIGKIPFVDATLIEDPTESSSCEDDDGKALYCIFSRLFCMALLTPLMQRANAPRPASRAR